MAADASTLLIQRFLNATLPEKVTLQRDPARLGHAGQTFYISTCCEHVVWNEPNEPLSLIFLA